MGEVTKVHTEQQDNMRSNVKISFSPSKTYLGICSYSKIHLLYPPCIRALFLALLWMMLLTSQNKHKIEKIKSCMTPARKTLDAIS